MKFLLRFLVIIIATGFLTSYTTGAQEAETGGPSGAAPAEAGNVESPDFTLPEVTVEEQEQAEDEKFVAEDASSATKTDTPIIETPQSISVVTEKQIEVQAAQSVNQALRYTPGVFTVAFEQDARFENLNIRGFSPALYFNTLLFPDSTGHGSPNIEPYGLERIEVLKGPSSALFGEVPPGGLVNMISKRPTPVPLYEVLLQYGSYDRYQAAIDLGGPIDKGGTLLYRLTALVRDSNTQTDYVEDNRIFIAPSVTWQPLDSTSITILGYFQKDDNRGLATQFLPSQGTLFFNPNGKIPVSRYIGEPSFDRFDKTQYFIGYEFEHRFNQMFLFRQNLRYSDVELNENRAVYGNGLEPDLRTLNRGTYDIVGDSKVFQVDNQGLAFFNTGPVTHEVLAGFTYLWFRQNLPFAFGTGPTLDVFDPVYGQPVTQPPVLFHNILTQNRYGIYLQDQISFQGLILTLSGRHDWVDAKDENVIADTKSSQDDSAFSGRAGVNYVFDFGLAPYFGFSTSFQPVVGTNFEGNQFKPTRGQQFEGGVKYQPQWFPGLFTAAIYTLKQTNVLTPDPVNQFFQVQQGEIRVRGIELEGQASPVRGLNVVAGYAYTDAEYEKSNVPGQQGNEVIQVPKNQASAWADYTLQVGPLRGAGIGGGVRYFGDTYGDPSNEIKIPSVTLFDAAVYYDFGGLCSRFNGLKVAVNAQNTGDKTYVSTCTNVNNCYYGSKRNILATLTYSW